MSDLDSRIEAFLRATEKLSAAVRDNEVDGEAAVNAAIGALVAVGLMSDLEPEELVRRVGDFGRLALLKLQQREAAVS